MSAEVDPDKLPVGTVVDGWRVVKRLGGGAYGTVYQVEKGGAFFAMKVALVREHSRDKRHTHARTERELTCLLSVHHPCIARVWAHGRWPHPTEGFIYFIMDYVEGYTLDAWCERTRITSHELVVLVDKVLGAVAHLHAQGIFHRDLKPGNILVRAPTGEPVVVDYGVAHFPVASAKLTDQQLPPGTPRYTSPEAQRFEALHRRDRTARYEYKVSDELYALGVTLYDLLTDPQPASNPEPQPLLPFGQPAAHSVNARVPEALSLLAARLMAPQPAQRPESVEATRRDVAEMLPLSGEPWTRPLHALALLPPEETEQGAALVLGVPVLEASPHPPPRRGLRVRPALFAVVGLCVLLACGAYLALRGRALAPAEAPAPMAQQAPAASSASSAPGPVSAVPPGAPPVAPPPPGPLAPAPSPPVSLPQKGTPVNVRNAPEATVPSPCSEKKPPPRGSPRWVAWCKCAAIVGTLVASQEGCQSVPFRQSPTAECAPESVAAMQALGVKFGRDFRITLDVNHPCVNPGPRGCDGDFSNCAPDGPITGRVEKSMGQLVKGTLLSGIIAGWPPDNPDLLRLRYTEATLPDGTRHPVCIEFGTSSDRKGCGPREMMAPLESEKARAQKKWIWTHELNP